MEYSLHVSERMHGFLRRAYCTMWEAVTSSATAPVTANGSDITFTKTKIIVDNTILSCQEYYV